MSSLRTGGQRANESQQQAVEEMLFSLQVRGRQQRVNQANEARRQPAGRPLAAWLHRPDKRVAASRALEV